MFNNVLAESGIKPPWVEKSIKIKKMINVLEERIQLVLIEYSVNAKIVSNKLNVANLSERRPENLGSIILGLCFQVKSLQQDVQIVNTLIKDYNLQVPSVSLQRMQISIESVFASAFQIQINEKKDKVDFALIKYLMDVKLIQQNIDKDLRKEHFARYNVDVTLGQRFLRKAERKGLLSKVTALAEFEEAFADKSATTKSSSNANSELNPSNSSSSTVSHHQQNSIQCKEAKKGGLFDSILSSFLK